MSIADTISSISDRKTDRDSASSRLPISYVLILAGAVVSTLLWIAVLGWGVLILLGLI
jgi:hypothetical protein